MAKWNINHIYEFTQFLTRKNQSGDISDMDLFYAWNGEQTAYFEDLKGRWQNRNNGKSGQNTGLVENETILTKLTPFTKPVSLTITAGNVDKPEVFSYRMAFRINGYDCIKINHNQIANVNRSVIDPPSVSDNKFYFVEYENYIYILPHSLPTGSIIIAELDYLTQPTDVIWGFSYDVEGRKIYNSGTSKQPQWMQSDILEITKRTLTSFGVSYKDRDFEQFGQKAQATGE